MLRKFLLVFLLFLPLPSLAAGERLLFWEVSTASSRVYLLGSMHLAKADLYPLRPGIMQAFAAADKLVVELDIEGVNQLMIQQRMLERGSYPAGRSIRDDLSATTWQALSARLQANGLPPLMFESMKPGLVVTTLSTLELMRMGLDPKQGVDRFFLRQARDRKPILELESVDRQLDVILDNPQPDLLVQQTLLQLDDMERLMAELMDSWKRGDAAALAKLVIDDELAAHPEFRDLHRRMFDDRNREMTDKIVALQQQGGSYFVVVGAGHLVGRAGIIALLEKRGQRPRRK